MFQKRDFLEHMQPFQKEETPTPFFFQLHLLLPVLLVFINSYVLKSFYYLNLLEFVCLNGCLAGGKKVGLLSLGILLHMRGLR